MTNFISSSNPYISGLKPKAFLGDRKNMLTQEKLTKGVNLKYYPKKDIQSYKKTSISPIRGLLSLTPWGK